MKDRYSKKVEKAVETLPHIKDVIYQTSCFYYKERGLTK